MLQAKPQGKPKTTNGRPLPNFPEEIESHSQERPSHQSQSNKPKWNNNLRKVK